MKKCIFCQIRDGEIPTKFEYEDDDVMVFPDINPLKPVHILIVPKKHIKDFLDFEDSGLWEKIISVVKKTIKKEELQNKGYRVHLNGGGAQIVEHLHIHVTGPIGKVQL